MSMDFERLNALAEGWMRARQAHLERERGSVYFHGQRVAVGVLELRRRVPICSTISVLTASGCFR